MPNNIAEIARRHKRLIEALAFPAIVVLIGLSAFGLGRLSVLGERGPRLIIQMPESVTQAAAVGEVQKQNQ